MKRTHEQIVDITGLENPPFSITADEVGHSSDEKPSIRAPFDHTN